MRAAAFSQCGLLFCVVLGGGGCAFSEKVTLTDSGAPAYHRLHIVYDVKSDDENFRLDRPATVQTVSHSRSPDGEAFPQSHQLRLEANYPYADVQPEFARVASPRATGGRTSGPSTDGMEEMLVLDMPKTELDKLLVDLARSGFFDPETSAATEAHLQVTYNRGEVAKSSGATEPSGKARGDAQGSSERRSPSPRWT